MDNTSDQELLRQFAVSGSETAFAELVRRHMGFVYSAARRMVQDAHLAQDVTQRVFVALARSSSQLVDRPVLSGWMHRTTRNIAAETIRNEVRRRSREQEAASMKESISMEPEPSWDDIAPHLDDAVSELAESDRDALLLRYFERKSAGEIAEILGINSEAAQKRVQRALGRLRELFARRGVAVGPGALATLLGANVVESVPTAVAASVSAGLAGTTFSTLGTTGTIQTIAMTTLQKTIVTALITGGLVTGIYQARQVSSLEKQVLTLENQNAPLTARVAELASENERLAMQLRSATNSAALGQARVSELMQLRSKATLARSDSQELARLKSALNERPEKIPDYMTNAIAQGLSTAEKWGMKDSAERLARMKEMLKLTDEQVHAIGSIMTNHILRQSEMVADLMTGKRTAEQIREQRAVAASEREAEINSRLTAEQLARLPEYNRAEKQHAAEASASSDARELARQFSLSNEQQEQLRLVLYQINSDDSSRAANNPIDSAADDDARLEQHKRQLEEKLQAVQPFLSPEQLASYRKTQLDRIQMQASALKMFKPKPASQGE